MLLGILQYEEDWIIKSNHESGIGYSNILIETSEGIGIIIELKYVSYNNLERFCEGAFLQMEQMNMKPN
jgi:hypothetical protein